MAKPMVAIVGRPNVGKSMLFNKLAGKRLSIVEDTPGVTRDRLYADCDWNGREFTIVDTGGIEPRNDNEILQFMRGQAEIAIDNADVIVLVCDIRTGVTAADQDVANLLLRSKKPVVLAVNKADRVGPTDPDVYEFYNLGLGDPIAISAIHGHGGGRDAGRLLRVFPRRRWRKRSRRTSSRWRSSVSPTWASPPWSTVSWGRSGSSSAMWPAPPGTQWTATLKMSSGKYVLIDTAGMRKEIKGKRPSGAVLRPPCHHGHRPVVTCASSSSTPTKGSPSRTPRWRVWLTRRVKPASSWSTSGTPIEKDDKTMDKMRADVRNGLAYMTYAPILFISALTGQRVNKLFAMINHVCEQSMMRIRTGTLNSVLADATTRVQPPTDRGRRLKIYYMTQVGIQPPTFVVFCNDAKLFHFSYQRYLENQIRNTFGLEGTPIRLIIRAKGEKGDL